MPKQPLVEVEVPYELGRDDIGAVLRGFRQLGSQDQSPGAHPKVAKHCRKARSFAASSSSNH